MWISSNWWAKKTTVKFDLLFAIQLRMFVWPNVSCFVYPKSGLEGLLDWLAYSHQLFGGWKRFRECDETREKWQERRNLMPIIVRKLWRNPDLLFLFFCVCYTRKLVTDHPKAWIIQRREDMRAAVVRCFVFIAISSPTKWRTLAFKMKKRYQKWNNEKWTKWKNRRKRKKLCKFFISLSWKTIIKV